MKTYLSYKLTKKDKIDNNIMGKITRNYKLNSMIINQEEILKDYKIDQIIIPGDIIEFKNEDQIPCDAILLKGYFY